MPRELQFKASKTQRQALRLLTDNEHTEIWFGGAAGGGKSFLVVAGSWMLCQAHPWIGIAWVRNELKRLKQTTLATYYKFCAEYDIPDSQRGTFNSQDSMIRFANGSEIFLIDGAYQPSDPLYTRFGGLELTMAFLEESNELAELCISIIGSRVGRRLNDKYWLKQKTFETFNPDKWHVYRRFYKPYATGTMPPHRAFVVSKIEDNPLVDKGYREQLERLPEVQKQRLLYGNFEYDDTPGRLYEYSALTDLFTNPKNNGQKFITCDVAREGRDCTKIYVWDGWEVKEIVTIEKSKLNAVWEKVEELANKYNIWMSQVVADEDGVGGWVVDYLKCRGFVNNSTPISPMGKTMNPWLKRNYQNLKTQCYFALKDPIDKRLIRLPDVPNKDKIIEELDAMVQIDIDKDAALKIIPKDKLKEKLGRSPDDADAIMMRMLFELVPDPRTQDLKVHEEKIYEEPINVYGNIKDYLDREEERNNKDTSFENLLNPYA